MSKHATYVARGCLNKRRHDSEWHAQEALRGRGPMWRAYKCKFCPGWHLTSGRRKAARQARAAANRGVDQ